MSNKELLLNDICGRLPYGLICHCDSGFSQGDLKLVGINERCDYIFLRDDGETYCCLPGEWIKPYLRPISSMTEEERYEIQGILGKDIEIIDDFINIIDSSRKRFSFLELQAVFDWLNAHHFDYRGLIEKGLALEATEDMYYIPETIKEDKPINFSKLNDDMYNKEGWITIRDGLKMDREGHIAGGLKLK